ncbi:hypothetical protein EAE96_009201 [Botrytis aclada]|nr:hypothetical protein EAE96_009201 [Botrytis aclada]
MSDSDAPTNVSVRDLDYSGLRKAIDTRLNKYFERLDAPESRERPKAIHRNDFYKFTIRAEEPNVEFIKFVPKMMWCSKMGVYKHVSRERAYELRIVLDEFCEEWCGQWLTGDAGIFFVQIHMGAHVTRFLAKLDKDHLRFIMARIVRDEGIECPIYGEKNETKIMVKIDPSKLSHNDPRKMITAYTIMDAEEIRTFLQDLYYKSFVDKSTRRAKIRCDLRLEGQKVFSQVKVWEQGDSDFNKLGDENEDELLFEKVLGGDKDGGAVWRRRIWFVIQKMKAPQLRRVIHVICGGVYKLNLPTDRDYFNSKEDLASRRIFAVVSIIGTRVVLTNEAESCDLLEGMTADGLQNIVMFLCDARLVSISFIGGKQLLIDGRTIKVGVCEGVKPQGERPSESVEEDRTGNNSEEEEISDHEVEVESFDEEASEPEPPIPRKRPTLWLETNQLLR